MGVSILSDGLGKPFSLGPAADDDLICRNAWNGCIHSQWFSEQAILSASYSWWWLDIQVVFKSCAPFTNFIRDINSTQIDNAKDIDV